MAGKTFFFRNLLMRCGWIKLTTFFSSEMTFNQIAEHFAARWGKDVNRTHIASIMRLREKQSDQVMQFNKRARITSQHLSLPQPPVAVSQSLPMNPRAMLSPPTRSMPPMSGLDLFNMLPQEMQNHVSPDRAGSNCDKCPARFETRQVGSTTSRKIFNKAT